MKSGVTLLVDSLPKVLKGIDILTKTDVMVGVPSEKDLRRGSLPINNASLAYIHEHGAPTAHIPARPFLYPGIASVKGRLDTIFKSAAKAAIEGNLAAVEPQLHKAGIVASQAAKAKISEGIPPPLAPSTIKGRIRRIKGKKRRKKIMSALAAGVPESRQLGVAGVFTPLIVTGQLRNAITYVLRKVKRR
jgi:hypothetical protein